MNYPFKPGNRIEIQHINSQPAATSPFAGPLLKAGFLATRCDCRRVRHTEAQSTLDRKQRSRNLRGSFSVTTALENQQVLLVDDVMTTGATLNELATELKRAGASRVEAIVVARTIARGHINPE